MSKQTKTALWKKLLLSVSLPVILFVGGEGALRVVGFGQPLTFFIRDRQPGYLRTNPAFTSLFFPASFGLKPENFRLAEKKDPNTFRVFVLGESAAMGVPEPGFGLAPQLQAQWRAAYPTRQVEVYNLGVTAINSHCVRLIAQEALRLEPDLLVVYMGNNEVVGPYGPSSGANVSSLSLPVIRASLWIRSTRTGQLVQWLASKLARGAGASEWRGMEMFMGRTVSARDARLDRVYRDFGDNLNDLLSAAAQRNVPVALCTVAVNVRDCSPFASVHQSALSSLQLRAWEDASRGADEAIELERWPEARAALEAALAIDPAYSATHYKLASVLTRLHADEAARAEYFSALQLDALRFRADAKINDLIRQASRSFPNVTLVDTALALGSSAESANPLAGRAYFFEHVHLTWEGNYAVAASIRNTVTLGGENPRHATLDADVVAKRLGFTEVGRANQLLRMNELTGRPPFTGQETYAADRTFAQEQISATLRRLENPAAVEACAAVVAAAEANDPASPFLPFHLAQLQIRLGNVDAALESNRRASALAPESPELATQRAYLLWQSKKVAEAEALLRESQRQFPYYFQTYGLLAQLWSESGRVREGASWFAELVKKMPDSRAALEMYGQLLHGSGEEAKAEAIWQRALAIAPDSEGSLMPLVRRLLGAGRVEEAIDLLERAYRYNPKNFTVAALLEQIYDQRKEPEKRMKYMRAMIESGPVRPELFIDLGNLLRERKSFREAEVLFYRALRAAQASGDEGLAQMAAERLQASENAVGR